MVTSRTKEQFLDEVLDPNRVVIYCGLHHYYGPMKAAKAFHANPMDAVIRTEPMEGCAKCWQVYFLHEFVNTPPDKRAEMLDHLERAINDAAQLEDAGLFDFKVSRRPDIKIEKE